MFHLEVPFVHILQGTSTSSCRPTWGTGQVILGVIATFTIPKILQAGQNNQKYAIVKETIAAIATASYLGNIQNSFDAATYQDYMLSNINLVKVCKSNSSARGCRNATMQWGYETLPGGVLHNGAMFAMVANPDNPTALMNFLVDWNGDLPPNQLGNHELLIWCPFANLSYWYVSSQGKLPGFWDDSGPNTALWQLLIQNH